MKVLRYLLLGVALLILSGCATTRYDWNGYDTLLYQHYRNPANADDFTKKLQEAIVKAEQAQKVPPGLYAEYGYLHYEKEMFPVAVEYFEKEKQLWPESRVLMEKMISNAGKMMARNQSSSGRD